jgi:nucleotide-binding universal stress UspA family protein
MSRFLVAVDGSDNALRAVDYTIERWRRGWLTDVLLLTVQMPLPARVTDFLPEGASERYHRDTAEHALADGRRRLEAAQAPHEVAAMLGAPAETIIAEAARRGCDHIVMGSRGLSPVPSLLLGSVTIRTLHLATLPVIVVR